MPRLEKLRCPRFMETSDDTIRAISEICPLLREACFSRLGGTRASTAQSKPGLSSSRSSPNSTCGGRWVGYEPTRIEAIHACALGSQAHILDLDACHITADVIEAIVGTPPPAIASKCWGFPTTRAARSHGPWSSAAFLAAASASPSSRRYIFQGIYDGRAWFLC